MTSIKTHLASIESLKAGLKSLMAAVVDSRQGPLGYFKDASDAEVFKRYLNTSVSSMAFSLQANQHRKDVRQFLARNVFKSTTEGKIQMTIGSQFLARLNEAKKPAREEVPAAKVDAATERFKRSLRDIGANNLSDAIADTLNLLGVPGRFLNTTEVRDSIITTAQELKSRPARVSIFLQLHSALAAASLVEAKGAEGELEGNQFQKTVEEIISALGFTEQEGIVLKSIKRKAQSLVANQAVKQALIAFAKKFQIRVGDDVVGSKKPGQKVVEAEEVEQPTRDAPGLAGGRMQAAKLLLGKLGVDVNALPNAIRADIIAKMKESVKDPRVLRAVQVFNNTTD